MMRAVSGATECLRNEAVREALGGEINTSREMDQRGPPFGFCMVHFKELNVSTVHGPICIR